MNIFSKVKIADQIPKDNADYLLVKEALEAGKSKYGWRQVSMYLERKKKVIITETFTKIELDDKIMGLVRTTSLKKVKAIFKL